MGDDVNLGLYIHLLPSLYCLVTPNFSVFILSQPPGVSPAAGVQRCTVTDTLCWGVGKSFIQPLALPLLSWVTLLWTSVSSSAKWG